MNEMIAKVISAMDELMCENCKRDKFGCTPEQILVCTETFLVFLEKQIEEVKV